VPYLLFINLHLEKPLSVFFPNDELSQLGIVGMFPGSTRAWKLNTNGLSREKIDYLSDAFKEIAVKYNLNVN
jgi:Sep-tRNA:Cys-tRNA synthetase